MTILFASCVLFVVTLTSALPDSVLKWSQLEAAKSDSQNIFDGFNIDVDQEWFSFKEIYGRVFNTPEDESIRKLIFENNLKTIKEHNLRASRGLASYTMAVNEFSDLTFEEFKSFMIGHLTPESYNSTGSTYLEPLNAGVNLPGEIDWRKKGYVTPVKDQKNCGSCWAFSTTGSVEGQNFRKTGKLVSLSEQNLVDCSKKYGNDGCKGGNVNSAFRYIIKNGGIDTEASYPYVAKDQKCKFRKDKIGAKITGFTKISSGSEQKLQQAVANVGPVSVAIDASQKSFQHYSKGVYDEPKCSNRKLDHAVLVVGYGTESKKSYWLVKNSWGTKWGDQGYIKMSRNKQNQCGIATDASYPLV